MSKKILIPVIIIIVLIISAVTFVGYGAMENSKQIKIVNHNLSIYNQYNFASNKAISTISTTKTDTSSLDPNKFDKTVELFQSANTIFTQAEPEQILTSTDPKLQKINNLIKEKNQKVVLAQKIDSAIVSTILCMKPSIAEMSNIPKPSDQKANTEQEFITNTTKSLDSIDKMVTGISKLISCFDNINTNNEKLNQMKLDITKIQTTITEAKASLVAKNYNLLKEKMETISSSMKSLPKVSEVLTINRDKIIDEQNTLNSQIDILLKDLNK